MYLNWVLVILIGVSVAVLIAHTMDTKRSRDCACDCIYAAASSYPGTRIMNYRPCAACAPKSSKQSTWSGSELQGTAAAAAADKSRGNYIGEKSRDLRERLLSEQR